MKRKKRKGYFAPILIVALLCAYYIGFAVFIASSEEIAFFAKFLLAGVPLILSGALIATLLGRIREIKKGETDDLDKY